MKQFVNYIHMPKKLTIKNRLKNDGPGGSTADTDLDSREWIPEFNHRHYMSQSDALILFLSHKWLVFFKRPESQF